MSIGGTLRWAMTPHGRARSRKLRKEMRQTPGIATAYLREVMEYQFLQGAYSMLRLPVTLATACNEHHRVVQLVGVVDYEDWQWFSPGVPNLTATNGVIDYTGSAEDIQMQRRLVALLGKDRPALTRIQNPEARQLLVDAVNS